MIDIKPIKRSNLVPQVMECVKDYIVDNNLEAGTRLPTEKQFSEMLGISKTILREAMKSLEAVGIVEINVGNGMFVSDVDYSKLVGHLSYAVRRCPQDFIHLVKTRMLLEVGSLDDVLENIQMDDLVRLEDICDREANAETPEEYLECDMGFHKELVACSKNPLIIELSAFFSVFSSHIAPMIKTDTMQDSRVEDAQSHKQILESIRHRELESAKSMLRQHIGRYINGG